MIANSILIVDDRKSNRLLLESMVSVAKLPVFFAENGEQAIEVFATEMPRFIFMDKSMPGMPGDEATRIIRDSTAGRKALIIGCTTADESEAMLAAGCDLVLGKPLKRQEVVEVLTAHTAAPIVSEEIQPETSPDDADFELLDPQWFSDISSENPSVILAICDEYLANWSQDVATLKQAWQSRNWDDLAATAHAMRGTVRYLDTPLSSALEALERTDSERPESAEEQIQRLEKFSKPLERDLQKAVTLLTSRQNTKNR